MRGHLSDEQKQLDEKLSAPEKSWPAVDADWLPGVDGP